MYFGYGNDVFMEDFFNDPDIMAGLGVFFGVLVLIMIICFAVGLALYVLRSLALYKLAENRGMSNPGLAWIPFIGMFRAGAVADDISAKSGSKTYFRYLILGGYLLSWVFSGISSSAIVSGLIHGMRRYRGPSAGSFLINQAFSSLGGLVGIASFVIIIISLNKIYKCYNPVSSTSWTVLSVFFPFMQVIFLFMIKNRAPVEDWYGSGQNYYPPTRPQDWQAPPPPQYTQQRDGYYPPPAPNPPEPWEVSAPNPEPPATPPPWDSNCNPPDGD